MDDVIVSGKEEVLAPEVEVNTRDKDDFELPKVCPPPVEGEECESCQG